MTIRSTTVLTRANHHRRLGKTSDESLLLRYRDSGNAEAFSELVHRYERELYNYLCRYVGDANLAEDVFQATFLRIHLKAHLFQEGRVFRPWLYSIATHQAIDLQRKRRRLRTVSLDAHQRANPDRDSGTLHDCLESKTPDPSAQLEEADQRDWARRAVRNLPDHLRTAVILTSYHGLRYQEAADVLRIPVGTLKTRVHTARAILNSEWRRVAC